MDAIWHDGMDYWLWWALGLALVIIEMAAPGVFFLWLGIAAGVVGFLVLAWPDLSWQTQVFAFAVLSIASVGAGRWLIKRYPIHTDEPRLNRRGEQYVGRVFTLEWLAESDTVTALDLHGRALEVDREGGVVRLETGGSPRYLFIQSAGG